MGVICPVFSLGFTFFVIILYKKRWQFMDENKNKSNSVLKKDEKKREPKLPLLII